MVYMQKGIDKPHLKMGECDDFVVWLFYRVSSMSKSSIRRSIVWLYQNHQIDFGSTFSVDNYTDYILTIIYIVATT